ncbi:hypothetical protein PtB15_2B691 [Puccinia triticina]|nr:hypothetical protein PtB15_2B691 [Puccinia triticina]
MNSESSTSYGTPLLNFSNSNSNQSNILGNPTLYQRPNNQLELPGDRPSHFVLNSMASRGWPHTNVPTEITRDLNHDPHPGTKPIFSSQISSFHQALQNRQQPLPPGIPLPGNLGNQFNPVNIQHAQTLQFQRNLDFNGLNPHGIHSQFHQQNPLNQVGQLQEIPTRNSQQHGQLQPNQSTSPSRHVPPVRSAQQLESDMLAEIADFNAATSGATRGTRGRGRGSGSRGSRGSQGSRGGRGHGGKSSVFGGAAPAVETQALQDPSLMTIGEFTDYENNIENILFEDDNPHSGASRQQLEPAIMEELGKVTLDDLRRRALKYAHYHCLTSEDRTELNQAYFAYQREIYLLICKRKLHVNPPLEHLGLLTRIRGAMNYINYCRTIGGADEDLESSQEANDTGRIVVCVGAKRPQKKMAAKKTKATKSNPTTNHRANRARANKKKNTGHTKSKRKRVVIEDSDTEEDSIPITNNPKKKQKHIEIEDDGGSLESFDGSRLDNDNVLTGDPINI